MEPLGGCKLSKPLADMWELCPAEQHNNIFFEALFFQLLPQEIRVLLKHEDHSDLRWLAANPDRLVAYRGRQVGSICAAATGELPNKVLEANSAKKPHKKGKQQLTPVPLQPQSNHQKQSKESTLSSLARQSSGLCG